MSSLLQVHLNKPGCSGRGIRYKILKTSELDHHEREAAKTLEKDDTVAVYNNEVQRMGVVQMLHAYTEPGQKSVNGTSKWIVPDKGELDLKWDELFTTKDTAILRQIYHREHGTSPAEVEAILTGKVEVLED